MRFQEEDENVKSLRTTHDGRRTKTDGNSSLEPSAQVSYSNDLGQFEYVYKVVRYPCYHLKHNICSLV